MSRDDRIRPIGRPGDAKPPEVTPPAPPGHPAPAAPPAQTPARPAQRPQHPPGTPVREPRLTPPAMPPQAVPHPPPAPPAPAPEPPPAEPVRPAARPAAPAPLRAPVAAPVAHLPPPSPVTPPGGPKGSLAKANLKWALWLVAGIAVTAAAGYLVAALWLFPAPLLPNERQVARVSGMSENDARRELERHGLAAEVTAREPSPGSGEGTVVWQDPPPGVAVPRGTTVKLILSSGLPVVAVPDVRGFDAMFAQRLIAAAGLRVEGIDTLDVKGVPPGAAGGTSPAAGDSVLLGRGLILHLVPSP